MLRGWWWSPALREREGEPIRAAQGGRKLRTSRASDIKNKSTYKALSCVKCSQSFDHPMGDFKNEVIYCIGGRVGVQGTY